MITDDDKAGRKVYGRWRGASKAFFWQVIPYLGLTVGNGYFARYI